MQSSSTISLNTLPRYLPLIEACNESRLSKLPNLLEILKKSQSSLANESRQKIQIAVEKRAIAKNASDLVGLIKDSSKKPKNLDQKLDAYKGILDKPDPKIADVVSVQSDNVSASTADGVSEYLRKCEEYKKKLECDFSPEKLGKLFVDDKPAFQAAKKEFEAQNEALVKEGEQWLSLLQHLISSYSGKKQKSQENRRILQDKVLQILNTLPFETQLIEALFNQVATYKTHLVAMGVFETKMLQFSKELKEIYDSKEQQDFAKLETQKDEYLKTYQKFVKEAGDNRLKLEEILKSMPEKPADATVTTHLNTIIMNDSEREAQTKKEVGAILSKTIKIYEDARKDLLAAQNGVDQHIEKFLKHRIDRLCNGIDWKDFRWSTWERSLINWTKYSDKTN